MEQAAALVTPVQKTIQYSKKPQFMPNHCSNTLLAPESTKPFKKLLKDYLNTDENGEVTLSFQKIIPMPEELRSTTSPTPTNIDKNLQASLIKKYGVDNWYDWAVKNWGTKWDSYDGYLSEDAISFQTAWSPPLPVITALAQKLKTPLVLQYLEEGCGFVGEFHAAADGTTYDECYDSVEEAPQELLDKVGYQPWEDEEFEEEVEEVEEVEDKKDKGGPDLSI